MGSERRNETYLTDQGKNKVVDGDISVEGKSEANKKDQMMCQDRWEPTRI